MTAAKSRKQGLGDSEQSLNPASVILPLDQIELIGLDRLQGNPLNPRKTFDEGALKELAASIRVIGISQPLLVRVAPDDENLAPADPRLYQVIAGHRRREAAIRAGLTVAPCIVRELSDADAADLALIDNLQRADVPAIEEAEAFGELLKRYGSIEAVAAKVGKDVAYVAKRLKLLSLTTWSQDALRHRLITIDHALLLARLGVEDQNAALKWCLDRQAGVKVPVDKVIADRIKRVEKRADEEVPAEDLDEDFDDGDAERGRPSMFDRVWEPESVQRLKEHIASESGTRLDRAPWPMEEDWLLPDAGSCLDCPKNTKANTPLFGDLDITAPICTDGACFKAKVIGFVDLQLRDTAKTLAAKLGRKSVGDVEVLRVSWKQTSTPPRQLKDGGGVNPSQLFKDGQWAEAIKPCDFTRPAVSVDWSDANNRGYGGSNGKLRGPGEVIQACIEPKCKAHPKAYEKAMRASNQREKPQTEEQRKKEAAEESFVMAAERTIRAKVFHTILQGLTAEAAIHAVADNQNDAPQWRKKLLADHPKTPAADLEALTVFCSEFGRSLNSAPYWLRDAAQVKSDRRPLWELAKRLGVDADVVTAKHFHDEGAIAPWADRLYPKAIKWPKKSEPKKVPQAAPKAEKPAAKKSAPAKAAKKKVLPAAARKRIADAIKKRWAGARAKGGAK